MESTDSKIAILYEAIQKALEYSRDHGEPDAEVLLEAIEQVLEEAIKKANL